jgi:hypothetical protein
MSNLHVYQRVAHQKGVTINKLETLLGVANGTLRKAIERNSSITSEMMEKIVSAFPDISIASLMPDYAEMRARADKTKAETPPDESRGEEMTTVKALSLALEAKEQARIAEEKRADFAERVALSSMSIQSQLDETALMVDTLQLSFLEELSEGDEMKREDLQRRMYRNAELAAQRQRQRQKEGTFSPVGS